MLVPYSNQRAEHSHQLTSTCWTGWSAKHNDGESKRVTSMHVKNKIIKDGVLQYREFPTSVEGNAFYILSIILGLCKSGSVGMRHRRHEPTRRCPLLKRRAMFPSHGP